MYTIFDQVFLGFLATNRDVAFYSRAKQIYSIAVTITLSISTVLLPKLSYLYNNDIESYKRMIKKSVNYIYIFSVPCVFGICILAKDLMWLLGGKEFIEAYKALIILSGLIFTVSLSTWQYNQILVPIGREKVGLKVQGLMAIISILTNIILIPKFGFIGVSISLVFAEVIGTVYSICYIKRNVREVNIKYINKSLIKYIIASIIMTFIIFQLGLLNTGSFMKIFIMITLGSTSYFAILYLIREPICREFVVSVYKKVIKFK